MTERSDPLAAAAEALSKADALLITAGAGMGVDSGLPDFRGNEGFWRAYPPLARLGVSFIDMANPFWFQRDPELAWGFYGHRLKLYRETLPHRGFELLARWGGSMENGSFVFTSNVDGQFQRGGFEDDRIVECHGSIHHLQCTGPCNEQIWSADPIDLEVVEETFRAVAPLPECSRCGSLARPNVLMFNDWHWVPHRCSEQERRFQTWLSTAARARLAVVELGAGTAVPTVRMTSERLASQSDATLIRINPREPQVPHGHIGIEANALEALEAIDSLLSA
jgi:NAD-dependent SIR2 family protein deacetylase